MIWLMTPSIIAYYDLGDEITKKYKDDYRIESLDQFGMSEPGTPSTLSSPFESFSLD